MWTEHASTVCYMPTWTAETSTQHTLHRHEMVYHEWKVHNTCIIVWYSSIKIGSMTFRIVLLGVKGAVFVNVWLQHDRSKWTEEWKLHFARKCLIRKWQIKHGKMNQGLQQLARFLKTQKPIGCGTNTRKCRSLSDSFLPPNTRM